MMRPDRSRRAHLLAALNVFADMRILLVALLGDNFVIVVFACACTAQAAAVAGRHGCIEVLLLDRWVCGGREGDSSRASDKEELDMHR